MPVTPVGFGSHGSVRAPAVGHYPQIEAPELVGPMIADALLRAP